MDEIGSGAAAVLASTEDRYVNATHTATITATATAAATQEAKQSHCSMHVYQQSPEKPEERKIPEDP